jgi:CBS domain containing-hemolysin-like protein
MTIWYLAGSIVLLLLNGFFVGAEFALVAARRSQLEHLAEEGNTRARLALRSVRELSLMLAGAQLGITMASLGLGALAEPAVARLIEGALESAGPLSPGLLHSLSFAIALTIVVFFHMVIGEMAPKNIAIAEPQKSALWIAPPFRAYVTAFRPFIALLNHLANSGVRLFGIEPQDELQTAHSAEEIGLLISEAARGGMIDRLGHVLLSGAVRFNRRDAGSVMVPRTEVVSVPLETTPSQIEELVREEGHSRYPVYAEDLDHIVGFFHAKDLLRIKPEERERPLPRRFIRRMLVVPESRRLNPLLIDMKRERSHFALVIEEHGGTAGIVTLEDVLEELVGDIRDEHDEDELGVIQLDTNRYLVPGTLRIDEAERALGLDLPEGEYETVAGYLMDRLGRIPKRRDDVEHDGWRLRVRSMQRRRVVQVVVERTRPPALPGAEDEAQET